MNFAMLLGIFTSECPNHARLQNMLQSTYTRLTIHHIQSQTYITEDHIDLSNVRILWEGILRGAQ